jgi:hypothetical protein
MNEWNLKITLPGAFWFAGWLFTIGYLHLSFWRCIPAIVLWPYDVGSHLG